MHKRSVSWLVIAAMAVYGLAMLPFAPARGAQPCPQLFTDKESDTAFAGTVPVTASNLDLIAGGIAGADNTSVTFELKLKDLNKQFPPVATSLNWYFHFTFNNTSYYASAEIDRLTPNEVLYSYGQQSGGTLSQLGEAEGSFNEGPGGTIQIKVPLSAFGASPGATFTNTFGTARVGAAVIVSTLDRGPDGTTFGTDFTVAPCSGGSPAPTASASGSPRPTVSASPTASPSPTTSPSPSPSPTASPSPTPTPKPKPKNCKKIKDEKKRKKCKKKNRQRS
jgi:hypothetical protein